MFALLTANSSAAVILPLVQECSLDQRKLAATLAQVTIADVLTIITLPLVLEPGRVSRSAVGALAVLSLLALFAALAYALRGRRWVALLRSRSRKRGWALELRVSLIGMFVLAAVAQKAGVSLLIAGFSGGLLLSWLGGPKRLDKQVAAVAQGFFVPIFFVSLGAKLNVGQVFARPSLLVLALALVLCAGVVHVLTGARPAPRAHRGPSLLRAARTARRRRRPRASRARDHRRAGGGNHARRASERLL